MLICRYELKILLEMMKVFQIEILISEMEKDLVKTRVDKLQRCFEVFCTEEGTISVASDIDLCGATFNWSVEVKTLQ